MNLFKQILFFSTSFNGYSEIVSQPVKKSFFYFLAVLLLSVICIYPSYFNEKARFLFPALEEIAAQFPKLEFKNNQLLSHFDKAVIVKHNVFSVVIDTENNVFKPDRLFPGLWLLLPDLKMVPEFLKVLFFLK